MGGRESGKKQTKQGNSSKQGMENLRKLQEYLFEQKETMPEQLYIQLMNNLKSQFDNLPSNKYRIEYLIYKTIPDDIPEAKVMFMNTEFESDDNGVLSTFTTVLDLDQLNINVQEQCKRSPFRPFEIHLDDTDHTIHLLNSANVLYEPDTLSSNGTDIVCQYGALVISSIRI